MSRPNLDAIEARAAAATPGQWANEDEGGNRTPEPCCGTFLNYGDHCFATGPRHLDEADAKRDTAFIAAARTDVPALCAYVRQLEADALAWAPGVCAGCGHAIAEGMRPTRAPWEYTCPECKHTLRYGLVVAVLPP